MLGGVWHWWKDNAEAVQALATTIGIVVGAMWALRLYFRKREGYPSLTVAHQVSSWRLPDDRVLLHLRVKISNVGPVNVQIRNATAWVQQVFPLPEEVAIQLAKGEDPADEETSEVNWPLAAVVRRCDWSASPNEIEPGENEELGFDFVLVPGLSAVQVYSHLRNHARVDRDIGWNTTTIHTLAGGDDGKAHEGDNDKDHEEPKRDQAGA